VIRKPSEQYQNVQNRYSRWNHSTVRSLIAAAALPVVAGVILMANAAQAQLGQAADPIVTVRDIKVAPASVAPGSKATVTLTLALRPGFHINANKPDSDMQIPTEIELAAPAKTAGVTLGKAVFPAPKVIKFSYSDKPLKVYEEALTVTVPVTVGKTAPAGKVPIKGKLHYQGCNDTACFPPATLDFSGTLTVAGKAAKK
jgi:DsbC/DsbD-like thiol-disulfide interchange protein